MCHAAMGDCSDVQYMHGGAKAEACWHFTYHAWQSPLATIMAHYELW